MRVYCGHQFAQRNYIYVCGPYVGRVVIQGDSFETAVVEFDEPVDEARRVILRLDKLGYGYFCRHLHLGYGEQAKREGLWTEWSNLALPLMRACSAVLLLSGKGVGNEEEISTAERLGIPVFQTAEELYQRVKPFKTLAEMGVV